MITLKLWGSSESVLLQAVNLVVQGETQSQKRCLESVIMQRQDCHALIAHILEIRTD